MTKKKSKRGKQSNQNNSERIVDLQYSGYDAGNSCGNPDPGKSYHLLLTNSDDYATDVPKISEYEIQRAWKAYIALHLHTTLRSLECKIETEIAGLVFPTVAGGSNQRLLLALGQEQLDGFCRLGELQEEREHLKEGFVECTELINKGLPFDQLRDQISVISLEVLEATAREECGVELQITSPSHSSSTASSNLAVHDLEEHSDRQESSPLQEYQTEYGEDGSASEAETRDKWNDDDNAQNSFSHGQSENKAGAAAMLDLLKPVDDHSRDDNEGGSASYVVADSYQIMDPAVIAAYGAVAPDITPYPLMNGYHEPNGRETSCPLITKELGQKIHIGAPRATREMEQLDESSSDTFQAIRQNTPGSIQFPATVNAPEAISSPSKHGFSADSKSLRLQYSQNKNRQGAGVTDQLASDSANAANTNARQDEWLENMQSASKPAKNDNVEKSNYKDYKIVTLSHFNANEVEEVTMKDEKATTENSAHYEKHLQDNWIELDAESRISANANGVSNSEKVNQNNEADVGGGGKVAMEKTNAEAWEVSIKSSRTIKSSSMTQDPIGKVDEGEQGLNGAWKHENRCSLLEEPGEDQNECDIEEESWQTVKKKKPRHEGCPEQVCVGVQVQAHKTPMENAMFSGKGGKMRRKTDICRAYQKGECGWGSRCNYAHSEADMKVARDAYKEWKRATASSVDSSVIDDDTSHQVHTTPMDNVAFSGEEGKLRRKTDLCKAYQRGECDWGSRCNYAHNDAEHKAAQDAYQQWRQTIASSVSSSLSDEDLNQAYPTPMENPLFNGEEGMMRRKTEMCRANQRGDCLWDSQCNYAHNDDELRAAQEAYKKWKLTNGHTLNTSLNGEDAFSPAHTSPMENPDFSGEKGRMRRKTDMCRAYQKGRCRWDAECNYAHNEDELEAARDAYGKWKRETATSLDRHLPKNRSDQAPILPGDNPMFQGEEGKSRRKTEMCRAYQRGSCYWGSECNYAHDEDEMRAAREASEALSAPIENPLIRGVQGKPRRKKSHQQGRCFWNAKYQSWGQTAAEFTEDQGETKKDTQEEECRGE